MIERIKKIFKEDIDPEDDLEIVQSLGRGSFGYVFKAIDKKTNQFRAVKIIPIKSQDEFNICLKELEILQACSCPNIVKYYCSYFKDEQIWIVLEFCEGGSLKDLIQLIGKGLKESQISCILKQILIGIGYLHQNKMIHRDIKADNILLNSQGEAKLADFGVSTQLVSTFASKESFIGSPFWMSPEILNKGSHNNKTDIWSVGITAIEMAEMWPPFTDLYPYQAMRKIKENPQTSLSQPEKWSYEFNDFVKKCLNPNHWQRPSVKELLEHPFVKEIDNDLIEINQLVEKNMNLIENYWNSQLEKVLQNHNQEPKNDFDVSVGSNKSQEQITGQETVVLKDISESDQQRESQVFQLQIGQLKQKLKESMVKRQFIENQLSLNPKVKISQIQETIKEVKLQYNKSLDKVNQKYQPILDSLESYIKLKKETIVIKKKLNEYKEEYGENIFMEEPKKKLTKGENRVDVNDRYSHKSMTKSKQKSPVNEKRSPMNSAVQRKSDGQPRISKLKK